MTTNTKGYFQSVEAIGADGQHRLDFQFNPTTISEKRGSAFNFSEAQGQWLPLAQFGRFEPIELSFTLFLFSHKGLTEQIKSLRRLNSPRRLDDLTYYEQTAPFIYQLHLGGLGVYVGVVQSVNITYKQYSKTTMTPIHAEAEVVFRAVSQSVEADVQFYKATTR